MAQDALSGIYVRVVGEVSEISNKPGYKAVYFTIKDEAASLPCMMWVNRFRAADVDVRVGSLVELTGRFTIWAPKGRMSFEVLSLSLSGEGVLRMQVAERVRRLQAEGLMDASRKRPLPLYPQTIGVVTSPRGAAIHDVLRTLRRRFPLARVLLAGVPVEGASAPANIIQGLSCVCAAQAEVVLVVRGGGSFEDLMPFNDELLARTIACAPVPIVTGIGHEPDTTIADMVSDLRASTPTAAAEAVSPARDSLDARLVMQGSALTHAALRVLEQAAARLRHIAERPVMANPEALFSNEAQALDFAAMRLARAIPSSIDHDLMQLASLKSRFCATVHLLVYQKQSECKHVSSALQRIGAILCEYHTTKLSLMASRLHDLSPLAVLARGYAIARSEDGALVHSIAELASGDRLDVAVGDGCVFCRVESTQASHIELTAWKEVE